MILELRRNDTQRNRHGLLDSKQDRAALGFRVELDGEEIRLRLDKQSPTEGSQVFDRALDLCPRPVWRRRR